MAFIAFAAFKSFTSHTVFISTFAFTLQVFFMVPVPREPDPIIARITLSLAPLQEDAVIMPEAPNVKPVAPIAVFPMKSRLFILSVLKV